MKLDFNNKTEKLSQVAGEASIRFKGLFPVDSYINEANEVISDCGGRTDCLQGDMIPEDLADTEGQWLTTSDGSPVAGIIPIEDSHVGGDSPAVPLVLAMWPVVTVLAAILTGIGLPSFAILLQAAYALYFYRLFGGFALIGFLLLAFPQIALEQVARFFPYQLSGLVDKATIISGFIPCLIPIIYSYRKKNAFAQKLAETGAAFNSPALRANAHKHKTARSIQVVNALMDKSHFITTGFSNNTLSGNGDSLSPDANKPFGQTTKDMGRHVFLFGKPGTGKTTLANNIIAGILIDEYLMNQGKTKELTPEDIKQSSLKKKFAFSILDTLKAKKIEEPEQETV